MIGFAGIDGCRGGWVAALLRDDAPVEIRLFATFRETLFALDAYRTICVDMPIGLPARAIKGGRPCDTLARARVGARRSSVFAVPARAVLAAVNYPQACALNFAHSDPPRKIAKQMFHILPRVREIDELMTPALQARVFEAHPELSFTLLNGGAPLDLPKKMRNRPYADGMRLRRVLLARAGIDPPAADALPRLAGLTLREDDVLDACACAFSARRIASGAALCLPDPPPRDARGSPWQFGLDALQICVTLQIRR